MNLFLETASEHVVLMQAARQHMIYMNAAMVRFGRTPESGAKLGEHLLSCDFVETFQNMWRRHFKANLFNAEEMDQILLYNMLVSLQVIRYTGDR